MACPERCKLICHEDILYRVRISEGDTVLVYKKNDSFEEKCGSALDSEAIRYRKPGTRGRVFKIKKDPFMGGLPDIFIIEQENPSKSGEQIHVPYSLEELWPVTKSNPEG